MKTLLTLSTIAWMLATTPYAFAQGVIHFANSSASPVIIGGGPIGIPVMPDPRLDPASYEGLRVGLYFSTDNSTYLKAAEARFSRVAFGLFQGGNVAIPGVPGGQSAWFQVRVWEASYGADYEAAAASGLVNGRTAYLGVSNIQNLSTGTLTPTELSTGLQSFHVTSVPEPATYALGLLGLAGWLVVRRHSQPIRSRQ